MKPFLGIDITNDKKNTVLNGLELVTANVSETQANIRDQVIESAQTQNEKAKMPMAFRILRTVCMVFGLSLLIGIFRVLGENEVTLMQALQDAPLLFVLCAIFLAGWALVSFFGNKKERNFIQSDETKQAHSRVQQALQNSYAELGVPANAVNFDLLMFRYQIKKDQVVPTSLGPVAFIACDFKIFSENGNLCLADADQRYEIPLSSIERILTVHKDGAIPSWNKNEPVNQPPYKQYKLRIDNYGFLHFKPYYILEFSYKNETWGMYFPNYELPTIENLTGLHPQE